MLGGWDQLIAGRGAGGSLLVVLAIAILLGLRHALDPDHLVAVSTLVATDPDRPVRRSTRLGLAWGLGHASTLTALGLVVILAGITLPVPVERAADGAIGLVIVVLALRLLRRWRAGSFHVHVHAHGGVVHSHLHDHAAHARAHAHPHRVARSPLQAYGIGLVHGTAGTGAVTVLLLATIHGRGAAAGALCLFAAGTAVSMAAFSTGFGYAFGRDSVLRIFGRIAPALGFASLAFGAGFAVLAAV